MTNWRYTVLSLLAVFAFAGSAVFFSSEKPDGLEAAAQTLGIAVDEIAPTTESELPWVRITMVAVAAVVAGSSMYLMHNRTRPNASAT